MKKLAICILLLSQMAFATKFSLMSYNLENFFDTVHDPGKDDWTYLPKSFKSRSKEAQDHCQHLSNKYYQYQCLNYDWDTNTLMVKIKNMAKVIKNFDNGQGPDILVLSEVENMNAVEHLIKYGLQNQGYKYKSLIEGPDERGIDLAIVSRYPIEKEVYHKVDISKHSSRPTRGILEAVIKIGGKKVSVFANHWPSQGNGDLTRLEASRTLAAVAAKSSSDAVIAAGDFNTIDQNKVNGIDINILPKFEDLETKARQRKSFQPAGTHWYQGEWTSLDHIFVLKSKLKNFSVDYDSFNIMYSSFMLKDYPWIDRKTGKVTKVYKGVPIRFDAENLTGYSDHLPISAEFNI